MIGIALRSLGSWSGKRKSLEGNAGDEEEGLAKGHSLHSAQEDVSRCTSWTRMALHLISGHEDTQSDRFTVYATTIASETTMAFPAQASKRGVPGGASQVTAALVHFFTVPTGSYSDISLPVKELERGVLNSCGWRRQESLGEERDRSRSRTLGLIRSGAGRGIPRLFPLLTCQA